MACRKKNRTFRKIRDAKRVFDHMNAKGKNVKWIYYCPECEGYHLTGWSKEQIVKHFK